MRRRYEAGLPLPFPRYAAAGEGSRKGSRRSCRGMTTCSAPPPVPAAAGRPAWAAARRGAVAMVPLLIGFIPFALVVGSVATEHGGPFAAFAGGWLIFGGSAHLATVNTLD